MLKELIDKFYLEKQRDGKQHHFYITDAGKCPRAVFFKFKNAPREEMDANILRIFEHGDHIHEMIMKPLLSIRDIHVVASEVNIPPQELVSGRADAILSDGKQLYVLDIKSMNSMVFRNLNEPKSENIDQIQLYLHYFRILKGILLYVSKDNQDLKEFAIDYNKRQSEGLLAGLADLKKKIDSNMIPSRISGYSDDWQCRYCQFKEVCKMTNGNEMKWEEFKEKMENN